ncbi:MAG: hypothetical protein HKL91_01155 [Candidatus Eremiobacteraeota bacterium]|nr:hypothetical protein [Candidatus Eremiobacteraeota bacterium]
MERLIFGPFELDVERLVLSADGIQLALGPKVVETLLALAERPGEILAKSELLARIWPEGFIEEASLSQNVYVLRKTMRAHWDGEVIETLPRRGYRFVAPIVPRVAEGVPLAPLPAAALPAPRQRRWLPSAVALFAALVLGALGLRAIALRGDAQTRLLPPNAQRLYALGRYYWNERSQTSLLRSLSYFHRVVTLAPRDPRGYEALASAEAMMGDYGYGAPSLDFAAAGLYAKKAIALDPSAGEAYAALGAIALDRRHFQSANRLLERAVRLTPKDAPAREWLGILRLNDGDAAAGYRDLRVAARLDPLSTATTAWLAQAAYFDRHFHQAIAYAHQALDLDPHGFDNLTTVGLAQEALGKNHRAAVTFEAFSKRCASCRNEGAALLADLYAREGKRTLARHELALARADVHDVGRDDLAFAFAALGKRGSALAVLAHAGTATHLAFEMDPRFDTLRGFPLYRSAPRVSS